VILDRESFNYGFGFGHYDSEHARRFLRNWRRDLRLKSAVEPDLATGFDFGNRESIREARRTGRRVTWMDWAAQPEVAGPQVQIILPPADATRLSREEAISDVAGAFEKLLPLVRIATDEDPWPAVQALVGEEEADAPALNSPFPLDTWTQESGFEAAELERWVRAVERKGQAILYGPPGTGKTFMAQRMAKHLVGLGERDGIVELVQFHPSYAYEDFVLGIRPVVTSAGAVVYELVEGRFLDFCRRAAARKGRCVLIIDEINRAHLSRVFGELMYLLEYRHDPIPLAGGRPFRIPENVRLIGTMNTADRSIAIVDHALRRRFAFIEIRPNLESLRRFHQARRDGFDPDGLIAVLHELNKLINNAHYEIGTSFFLRPALAEHLEDIWRMEIEPYVEEHFFDQEGKLDRFRWDAVKQRILGAQ
jgi:5-methylcytosine-specific restriction protein B